jgi:hypothetical protein
MASLSVLNDVTTPLDTSNWTQVTNKKSSTNNKAKEKLEAMKTAMKKTKISIVIRIPSDAPDDYSAAEVHVATIRELSKQDSNLVVLDSKGINQINIHKAFGPEKYKEAFQPREKTFNNGTAQVSIAHHVLSEVESFNKALLIPFLRKNKVFIYFNQKEGLEHFSAIGVLFGIHPELTWRQDINERIEQTMKSDITQDECKAINTNFSAPKIVISMAPQQISNPKFSKTTSIALEIRVPAAHEQIYINILDRLNERESNLQPGEVDLVLDKRVGIFFPYYAKKSRPKLFDSLMRKQNSDMNSVSAIPLFGITTTALDFEIPDAEGRKSTVREWIYEHENVIKMEKTASSVELGKYMLIVDREDRESVEDHIDQLFNQLPDFENQSVPFKKPQRGGNAFKKNNTMNISNYLNKLEQRVQEDLSMYDEDTLSESPPQRPRRMTISYAQAAKRLSFQSESKIDPRSQINSNSTMATTMSTLTQGTLDEAMEKLRAETTRSITKLREDMQKDIQHMEEKIALAVINALRSTPSVVNMDIDNTETMSVQSTQTATTIKTLADQFEALTQVVQVLSDRVTELTEKQENTQNKRIRSPEKISRQSSPIRNTNRLPANSPPNKQPRASIPTPPATPPPKGNPAVGSREGK